MKDLTVLIPTYQRTSALAVTLSGLCSQTYKDFDIVISDQNDSDVLFENESIQTTIRLLKQKGHQVSIYKHLPRRGLAEQRQFLLDHSQSPYSLFLDDDLLLEPFVIEKMKQAIEEEKCGFVGRAPIGLSYANDVRQEEQHIEFWEGSVTPEEIKPSSEEWQRYKLHNAANLLHVEKKYDISPQHQRKYKVSWVGGCVLYDTDKLKKAGAFTFWTHLPKNHAGEDVLAQLHVMKQFGGCGLLPSGVYHQELPTTVKDRRINAPEILIKV